NPVDLTADCDRKTHLCNIPQYDNMMDTYCQKTCKRPCAVFTTTTTLEACLDVTPDCLKKEGLCSIPAYNSMTQRVRTTTHLNCGFIKTSGPSSCSDATANCAQNPDLCRNPAYDSIMKQYCAKTCQRSVTTTTKAAKAAGKACTDKTVDCASRTYL
ncbi:hypothetical protein PMAYCL1PPCAC_10628, partial [Pristionchus mayeri]